MQLRLGFALYVPQPVSPALVLDSLNSINSCLGLITLPRVLVVEKKHASSRDFVFQEPTNPASCILILAIPAFDVFLTRAEHLHLSVEI